MYGHVASLSDLNLCGGYPVVDFQRGPALRSPEAGQIEVEVQRGLVERGIVDVGHARDRVAKNHAGGVFRKPGQPGHVRVQRWRRDGREVERAGSLARR